MVHTSTGFSRECTRLDAELAASKIDGDLKTGDTVRRRFTTAVFRDMALMAPGMRRRGQERFAAGEKGEKVWHQRQVKTASRGRIFSHITLEMKVLFRSSLR